MAETPENLTYEILKRIQSELADMRREMRKGLTDIPTRLDDLRRRIERIERRLDRNDETTP